MSKLRIEQHIERISATTDKIEMMIDKKPELREVLEPKLDHLYRVIDELIDCLNRNKKVKT